MSLATRESTVTEKLLDCGTRVAPEVGSFVKLDEGRIGEKLLPGDDFTCAGWDGCDFRYPNPVSIWRESRAIACNVHVTGRTIQYKDGGRRVRVKIEWVGDCEPSTFSGGWMYL